MNVILLLAVIALLEFGVIVVLYVRSEVHRSRSELWQERAADRNNDIDRLEVTLETQDQRHHEELASERARFVDELATQRSLHATERSALIETLTFGTPPRPAEHIAAPKDAEQRVYHVINEDLVAAQRELTEAAIQRGAERIRSEYETNGLNISMDEARLQAEAMLGGRSPTPEFAG